jgi:phosphoglycolate phosphatase
MSGVHLSAELIIFDLDGTLIDSRLDITRSVNEALVAVGLPPKSMEEVIGMIGNGTKALVERAVGEPGERFEMAFDIFTRDYARHLLDHTRFYPGVEEMLDRFGSKKLAVMSNKRQRFCDAILRGLRSADRFLAVQGGDTAEAKKPDPAPLLKICRSLGVDPRSAAMVGDSPVDVTAGRDADMVTIGVTDGFTPPEVMRQTGADFLIPNVSFLFPADGNGRV